MDDNIIYILFIKIFSNKFLNDKIYGFIRSKFKYGCFSYDQITNVEWMIVNKHYSLLKDKVKNKEMNLSFFIQHSNLNEHYYHLMSSSTSSKKNNKTTTTSTTTTTTTTTNLTPEKEKKRNLKVLYNNSIFKTNKEFDKQFYNLIFKNYFNQIFLIENNNLTTSNNSSKNSNNSNNTNIEKSIEILKNKLILNDNLEAFESLIETFELKNKIKIDSLKFSIENKSFKISKYLYSLLNSITQDIVINNQSNIWKDVIKNSTDLIKNSNNSDYSRIRINEIIKFLIKELKFIEPSGSSSSSSSSGGSNSSSSGGSNSSISPRSVSPRLLKLFSFNNFEFKIDFPIYKESLQVLIDSCKSIIRLGLSNLTESQFKKRKIEKYDQLPDEVLKMYLSEHFEILSMDNLNRIENQFTNEQLSTPLYILSSTNHTYGNNTTTNTTNNSLLPKEFEKLIKSLIKMILPFFEDKNLFSNYLFYFILYKFENGIGGKDRINGKTEEERDNHIIANSIEKLKIESKREHYIESFFLGEFCSSKIKRQIKYIDLYYFNSRIIDLTYILKIMVSQYSDLKLLHYIKEMILTEKEIQILQPENQHFELIKSIPAVSNSGGEKSIQLFDFIYSKFLINTNCCLNINRECFPINILFPNKINLLKHFKCNYFKEYNQIIGKFDLKINQEDLLSTNSPLFSNDAIEFIINNITDFSDKLYKLLILSIGYSVNYQYQTDFNESFLKSIIFNPIKLKLLLTNGFNKSVQLFKYYYYGKIDFEQSLDQYSIITKEIAIKGDTKLFDLILNKFEIKSMGEIDICEIKYKNQLIYQVLINSAFYGKLIVFKHIKNNFENLLNLANNSTKEQPQTTTTTTSLSNNNLFKKLIQISYDSKNYHIYSYLKNLIQNKK